MKRAIFLISLLLISNLFAWGKNAHRVVAEIAERHLDKSAKLEVAKLLSGGKMAEVANWADEIRSDSSWDFAKTWHYANISEGMKYQEMEKEKKGDVVVAIEKMTEDLKNKKASLIDKQNALKFLIHFMGDLHQPFHMGRPKDRGGNEIKVEWFGKKNNIHSVWDSELFDFQALSYSEYVGILDRPALTNDKQIVNGTVIDWANQSSQIVQDLYKLPSNDLGYEYSYKYKSLMESQLLKAGLRLAKILNEIY